MKIEVKATENVDMSHGDVILEAKAGETLAVSPREAEIALSTGKFEFVREITESEVEEKFVQNQQTELEAKRAEYKEKSHDALYDLAKDLPGVKKSMPKDKLIDELLKPRPPFTDTQTNSSDESGEKQGDDNA